MLFIDTASPEPMVHQKQARKTVQWLNLRAGIISTARGGQWGVKVR